MEQHALGRLDADARKLLRVGHRQDNCLDKLLNLFLEATEVIVGLGWLLVHLERTNARVILRRQLLQDEVRVLVGPDQVAGPQLVRADQPDHRQENRLPGRRLDHHGLALALVLDIHSRSILLFVVLLVHGEELDDVAHEVRELLVELDLLHVLLDQLALGVLLVGEALALRVQTADLVLDEAEALLEVLRAHRRDLVVKRVILVAPDALVLDRALLLFRPSHRCSRGLGASSRTRTAHSKSVGRTPWKAGLRQREIANDSSREAAF
mmetsp:Transcript_22237/g.63223  ORF Transcript_22237/g.63223 Transcript_22237/m.63223 type:complete len:267 (-) Transcript_22237:49-849(-)